jgi:2-dehydropantoate 2-reductase
MKTSEISISSLKIAVVGAGALGLYYGALLQRAGHEVHFLLRRDYTAIRHAGLQVRSVAGDFALFPVLAHRDSRDIGPVDLVLVGLKTFANQVMVDLIRPLVDARTMLLTLQNGLGNEELLAEAFGAQRTLGGVAFLCANRGEPGTVLHLGEGRIRLGEFSGGLSTRAQHLAERFSAVGAPCEAVSDLIRARWEKLVWNIPFNGLCTLTGKDVTELLAHPPSRALVKQLMEEVVTAANRQGLQKSIDGPQFIERMLEMSDRMDHYQPSMMLDRLAGRPLELNAIYDIPLQRAAAQGVDMTRVAMLHALLALGEASAPAEP